jgi:hypothetical protein
VHENPVSTGTPVPLNGIAVEAPVEELLASVSWPAAAPAREGSNCTVSVVDAPGAKVTGIVAPDSEKPVPVSVAELMVKAAAPVEVKVSV